MLFQSKIGRALAFAALIALTPAAACAQIATPTVSVVQGASHTVPFELYRGSRIVLTGKINGVETEMLLDSGASVTTIDAAFARRIGIKEGVKMQAQGSGGSQDAELIQGVGIEIGNLKLSGVSAAVIDLSAIEKALGRPIPVVLGHELFMNSVVELDFQGKRLSLTPSDRFAAPAGATRVDLKRDGAFHHIEMTINGLPAEAVLDLGNGGALSLSKEYVDANPSLAKLPHGIGFGGGVGGLHELNRTTMPKVSLAGFEFMQVPAELGGVAKGPYAGLANAGIQLFKPFLVALDLGHDRMWLKRTAAPASFTKDRAGLFVMLENDHFNVLHVSPGGPAAAAGLKAGDRIVRIGGEAVGKGFYSSAAADWARGQAGTPVALALADGRSVTVTLADYY